MGANFNPGSLGYGPARSSYLPLISGSPEKQRENRKLLGAPPLTPATPASAPLHLPLCVPLARCWPLQRVSSLNSPVHPP